MVLAAAECVKGDRLEPTTKRQEIQDFRLRFFSIACMVLAISHYCEYHIWIVRQYALRRIVWYIL